LARRGRGTGPQPFDVIVGRHSVRAALVAGRRTVSTVVVDCEDRGPAFDEIRQLARAAGVRVNAVVGRELTRLAGGDFHQGVGAYAEKLPAPSWDGLVAAAREGHPLVLLNHVEDPRNLGAVVRSAAAFGGGGVLIPARRQAPVTPAVAKAAEGGLEYVPVATVGNVAQAVRKLKAAGVWCYGLEGDGDLELGTVEFNAATALVLGGEDAGLGGPLRRECDGVVAIPLDEGVTSLNVAAAAAVALYEFRRQFPLP